MSKLDDAIEYIRLGNREEGREILEELLEEDEENDEGWLWMSAVVDDEEERQICLENVVQLNPNNMVAKRALQAIEAGTFDLSEMMSEALESRESYLEEEDEDEIEFDDDDELEMPSTMQERSGPNMRLILLGVFVLLIVCGLGGAAAYNLLLVGDGEDGPATQPVATQDGPAEVDETATPAPTDTPTVTPTATNTPFELPTAVPTQAPTPTQTQVVPPTPGN